jgi:hypothetical protein
VPGPKKQTPPPIDRPLSRAYLRQFTGWSTAYPPGLSDPTSLRVMENMMVNRNGSIRIRPGLRYLSYEGGGALALDDDVTIIGTHEVFFLADGSKAYLFAVREADDTVGFRAAKYVGGAHPFQVHDIYSVAIGFDDSVITPRSNFDISDDLRASTCSSTTGSSPSTTQAESTPGLFEVGAVKFAYVTSGPINRPSWANADKRRRTAPAAYARSSIRVPTRRSPTRPTARHTRCA